MRDGRITAAPNGMWMSCESSRLPASMRQTLMAGSSDKRAAIAQPADPPPTTM